MVNRPWAWRLALPALCGLIAGGMAVTLHAAPKPGQGKELKMPLPSKAPKGAIVLFSGSPKQLEQNWYGRRTTNPPNWTVENGVATPKKSDITSRQEFGDCYVHVEFHEPVDANGNAVGSGNSGVGLMGRYEVQILNSYGQQPEAHLCGALYSQKAPITESCKPPNEWQTFDIKFRAPRFDANGKVTEQARVTVYNCGVLVQDNAEFNGPTGIQYEDFKGEVAKGPIVLQGDHDPVQFRNVWVLPI